MGEKKFTLMELHLDGDTQFGPRTLPGLVPGTGDEAEEEEGVGTSPQTEETAESESRGLFPLVAGLIAMVAIALAVRKYRSSDADESESLDERDVVVN